MTGKSKAFPENWKGGRSVSVHVPHADMEKFREGVKLGLILEKPGRLL